MIVPFADFKNLDIRIGKIVNAEKIEGSDKLLKLNVDIGGEVRQIVAGIAKFYGTENLFGKEVPVVVNLEPRNLKGFESKGMMLAADVEGKPVLLHPEIQVPPGSIVR